MQVKLVSITSKVEELISYCARVSNPKNQDNFDTAPKLLQYLINHEHWSPFEMGHMVLEIETSRAIAAQILRHRSFSFQEFSQRYSVVTEFEEVELRKKADKNRQSSAEVFNPVVPGFSITSSKNRIEEILHTIKDAYNSLIEASVAKECARMILPLCTKTRLYMAGNIRSWIHYIQLRTKEDTQKEHRLIAEECKKIFIQEMPIVSDALGFLEVKPYLLNSEF